MKRNKDMGEFKTITELLDLEGKSIKIGTKGKIIKKWREAKKFCDVELEDGRKTVMICDSKSIQLKYVNKGK